MLKQCVRSIAKKQCDEGEFSPFTLSVLLRHVNQIRLGELVKLLKENSLMTTEGGDPPPKKKKVGAGMLEDLDPLVLSLIAQFMTNVSDIFSLTKTQKSFYEFPLFWKEITKRVVGLPMNGTNYKEYLYNTFEQLDFVRDQIYPTENQKVDIPQGSPELPYYTNPYDKATIMGKYLQKQKRKDRGTNILYLAKLESVFVEKIQQLYNELRFYDRTI
jgi:hypothetical protein